VCLKHFATVLQGFSQFAQDPTQPPCTALHAAIRPQP
jgi:hypothetical protein